MTVLERFGFSGLLCDKYGILGERLLISSLPGNASSVLEAEPGKHDLVFYLSVYSWFTLQTSDHATARSCLRYTVNANRSDMGRLFKSGL